MAPAVWLNALWRPESARFAPRRVLVAGCGTGREAFAIQHRAPEAEVVAVDLSPRAIAIAKDYPEAVRRFPPHPIHGRGPRPGAIARPRR